MFDACASGAALASGVPLDFTWLHDAQKSVEAEGGAQVVRCQPVQLPVHAEQQPLALDAPTTELHSPVMIALPPLLPPLIM